MKPKITVDPNVKVNAFLRPYVSEIIPQNTAPNIIPKYCELGSNPIAEFGT